MTNEREKELLEQLRNAKEIDCTIGEVLEVMEKYPEIKISLTPGQKELFDLLKS